MYHGFQLIRLFKESCQQTLNQAFRIFDTITGNEAIEREISFYKEIKVIIGKTSNY